jgi:hypothetical protein
MTAEDGPLLKHARYRDVYKPDDIYWGIGIENETYLQLQDGFVKPAESFIKNRARERYSVDYWSTYKKSIIDSVLNKWISELPDKERTTVNFPLLLNSHAFVNTDIHGEPKTTYSKTPRPNPKYAGKSLHEYLEAFDPTIFKTGKDVWWTFDGDTIEFMTQDFYCAKMEDVISELLNAKAQFISAVQRGLDAAPDKSKLLRQRLNYPKRNHGFSVYTTNLNNIGVFNNGTYHFNITLPTRLDKEAKIANPTLFEMQHRNAARLFQWLSPFLIAKYGSGDIFSYFFGKDARFPAGSQRVAASRYISVAMYDTEKMPKGKILTIPYNLIENRWYEKIYDLSGCAYNKLPRIGLDINFNKHWNHGLEFRIFDWFPEIYLSEVLRFLIWMCDESLLHASLEDPRFNMHFNNCTARAIVEGETALLTPEEAACYSKLCNAIIPSSSSFSNAHTIIYNAFKNRWDNSKDSCTSRMIRNPLSACEKTKETRGEESVVTVAKKSSCWCF